MALNAMTSLWARTGLILFIVTISLGMYLGMTQQFQYSSPHAHLGLLGWLSSIAFAFLYAVTDREGVSVKGPKAHWATHNLGVATMATALFLTIKNGGGPISALIGIGGLIVVISTIWLAVMMWPRLSSR